VLILPLKSPPDSNHPPRRRVLMNCRSLAVCVARPSKWSSV